MKNIFSFFVLMAFLVMGNHVQAQQKASKTVKPTQAQTTRSNKAAKTTANNTKAGQINWMTIEEAQERCKTEPRKIYIDVYTGWCGWCKKMDKTTFVDPAVVKYINSNYYAVKLDAETKKTITFNGKEFNYVAEGRRGYNEFASAILQGRMSYPTSVVLDEEARVIQPIPGYLDGPTMDRVLHYFGEDAYKKQRFEVFEKTYKPE